MTTDPLGKFKEAASRCEHNDYCQNPDAVSVRWYKCSKCGRTRKEHVKQESAKPSSVWSR